jgi:uncharacterized protein (TIGR00255 family)
MIKSMTGYGVAERNSDDYSIKVEIRSLNGKYLDLGLRVPKFLMPKEIELRKHFGNLITRGSATLSINIVKHKASENDVHINKNLATEYYTKLTDLSESLNAPQHDIFRITTLMQDVIYQDDESVDDALFKQVLEVGNDAYQVFDAFRKKEGAALQENLLEHCCTIEALLPQVAPFEAERLTITRERIKKNLNQLLGDDSFDKNRLEQELIYYAEKYDITEEKNRLSTHCSHFKQKLNTSTNGKSLGFIAQEMGREINTLGSKANHAEIQKIVVAMKEELEKIKEQTLNVL